jgi:hypothetical protein
MPKAAHTPTTSRRALLAATGAVAPVALPAAAANPDAALLRLSAEADALDQESDRMMISADASGVGSEAYEALWENVRAKSEHWRRLVSELVLVPATTPEGVRAKARLLRSLVPKAPDGGLSRYAETADAIAWSLTGDLLGVAA